MSSAPPAKHMAFATKLTREGVLDMSNRKPFRTAAQKKMARESAKRDDRGIYRSSAPVSYHQPIN